MQVIAIVPVYNEERFLPLALGSLTWCDLVWVIDGRYQYYPGLRPESQDATAVAMRTFPNARWVPAPDAAWPNEAAKRSVGLTGQPGDWYVLLDGDEVLVNGPLLRWAMLQDAITAPAASADPLSWIQLKVLRPFSRAHALPVVVPRAFRHPPSGAKMPGPEDYRIEDGAGNILAPLVGVQSPYRGELSPDVWVLHLKDLRDEERLDEVARYHMARHKAGREGGVTWGGL